MTPLVAKEVEGSGHHRTLKGANGIRKKPGGPAWSRTRDLTLIRRAL